ncbi:MAG TPA: hypothetical protein VM734_36635 [Kofleriaceae bacterium]|jgi:hypothetical protein|nr:hypothetical protein [Kofleriaceae bacterium]
MRNIGAAGRELEIVLAHAREAIDALAAASGALGQAGTLAFDDAAGLSPLAGVRKWWVMRTVQRDLERAQTHLRELRRLSRAAAHLPDAPEAVSALWAAVELSVEGNVLETWLDAELHNQIETRKLEVDAVLDEVGRLHARLRAL